MKGLMALTGSEGARCWQCHKQCVAILRWPGWLGFAGTQLVDSLDLC